MDFKTFDLVLPVTCAKERLHWYSFILTEIVALISVYIADKFEVASPNFDLIVSKVDIGRINVNSVDFVFSLQFKPFPPLSQRK